VKNNIFGDTLTSLYGEEDDPLAGLFDQQPEPSDYGFDPATRARLNEMMLVGQAPPAQGGGAAAGGMNPLQMAQTYNQVAPMFGGEALWGGESGGMTGLFGSGGGATGGAAAGGTEAAAGGGSSFGSMAASAGPWVALAAIIAGNEKYQVQHGNRSSDEQERIQDALTGKVLERDADEYLGKVPGAQWSARWGNPEGAWKNIKGLSNPKEHWKDTKKFLGKLF